MRDKPAVQKSKVLKKSPITKTQKLTITCNPTIGKLANKKVHKEIESSANKIASSSKTILQPDVYQEELNYDYMDYEESIPMKMSEARINISTKEINLQKKALKMAARIQTCHTEEYDCGTYEVYTKNATRRTIDLSKLREKLKNEINSNAFYSSQRERWSIKNLDLRETIMKPKSTIVKYVKVFHKRIESYDDEKTLHLLRPCKWIIDEDPDCIMSKLREPRFTQRIVNMILPDRLRNTELTIKGLTTLFFLLGAHIHCT